MNKFRNKKINTLLQKEITKIIQFQIRDKRIRNIQIEEVKVSPDLHDARIFFSTIEIKKKNQILNGLRKAKKYIRYKLAQELNLRYTPELQFIFDNIQQNANNIEELIKKERKRNEHE